MVEQLSKNQKRLLDFLRDRERKGSSSPSMREICEAVGYQSTKAASDLVLSLERLGLITRDPGKARSIRLVNVAPTGIPLLGSIAAGFPEDAAHGDLEWIDINPLAFGIRNASESFALRVRGDSMIGRHFFDGDVVLLDRSLVPKPHDVVAALIDQESTLKTFVVKNGKTWLKAENPAYPDLIPTHDLQIQGVAKAVIRILTT